MRKIAAPIQASRTVQSAQSTSPAEANLDEPEVWGDPEWEPALHALEGWQQDGEYTGKPDTKPLAKLLRSGKPVPEPVAVRLGVLLDPPWGEKGPKLTPLIPKRHSGYADLQTIKAMMAAKRHFEEELTHAGKLEAAIAAVKQKIGRSRSYLMKSWKLNFRQVVLRTSKFNLQPFLSPHEPDKS
jgi:hypothetical protein